MTIDLKTEFTQVIQQPLNIAVADDQTVMRHSYKRLLEKETSWQIHDFVNGQSLITFLKTTHIDLIITDIYMNRGDGFEVLNFVRSRTVANDIPIIFVSGEATKDDIVQSISDGVTDYIIKPFEQSEFILKILKLMKRYTNPPEKERLLREAECFYLDKKYDKAKEIFEFVLKENPESLKALTGLALCSMNEKNYQEAQKKLEQAIEINGLYFPGYSTLADLHLAQDHFDEAKSFLLKELSIHGKQPHRRVLISDLYLRDGLKREAFEEIRKGLILNPKNIELQLAMGKIQGLMNNMEKSIHYYLRARRYDPESVEALYGIALAYYEHQQPEKALTLFSELLKKNPKDKDIFLARSYLHELIKDYTLAAEDLERYLIYDGENLQVLKKYAELLTQLERHQDLVDVLKLIAKQEVTPSLYARIGLCYLKLNQYIVAQKYYQKAISHSPNNPTWLYNYAFILEKNNENEKALFTYLKVRELTPQNDMAQKAITRLSQIKKAS